jgi:prophage regulatory protein
MSKRLIPRKALAEKGVDLSLSQLKRKVKDGSFPKPIRIGARRVAWVEAEIDAWIDQRIAERDAKKKAA